MPRHLIAVLAAAAVAVLASAPAEARKSRGSSAPRPPVASPPVANPAANPVASPLAAPPASAARSNTAVPTSRPRPVMLFSIGSASAAPVAAVGEDEERASQAGRISPSAPRPTLARDAAPAGPLPPVLGSGEVAAAPLGGFAAVVPEGSGRFVPLRP